MGEDGYGIFFLNNLANLCQLYDLQLNLQQVSNDELMQHLEKQDKILNEQTIELQKQTNLYLKKIVEQNEEILNKLNNLEH